LSGPRGPRPERRDRDGAGQFRRAQAALGFGSGMAALAGARAADIKHALGR
jgi:hypothetical protein